MDHSFQIRGLLILDNAKYVMENMVYGNAKCFKGWVSTIHRVLLRKRNLASVAWVMIITPKIAKEEENGEYKIVTRTITSCNIFRRKMIQQNEIKMELVSKMVLDQTR